MANTPTPGTKHTEQNIANWTNDEDFRVIGIELLAYDPVNDCLRKVKTDENGVIQTTA